MSPSGVGATCPRGQVARLDSYAGRGGPRRPRAGTGRHVLLAPRRAPLWDPRLLATTFPFLSPTALSRPRLLCIGNAAAQPILAEAFRVPFGNPLFARFRVARETRGDFQEPIPIS